MRSQGKTQVLHYLDPEAVEWIDSEAVKRDRSRSWMMEEAIRQWRRRLEREREQRARKAARRAK